MPPTRRKPVESITPFTLLDFPKYPSAIVWFRGCNMRCSYCYNPHIVYSNGRLHTEEVLTFLQSRKGLLKGVVLSGGEATLYSKLPRFAATLKQMGYAIKLDTNGTQPRMIQTLLEQKLLDYVAIDFKATKRHFHKITRVKKEYYDRLLQSLDLLGQSGVEFEVRTTVHKELLQETDLCEIMETLRKKSYRGTYHLQNFREAENIGELSPCAQSYDMQLLQEAATRRKIDLNLRNFD